MRADRLLSIMLLLHSRGKMTASALAEELEVSERTVYRDIDALCTAGVPVYSESGHGGGYGLTEDYRTHLTGLSKAELRALMTLGSFAPLSDLGLRDELRAALLKISASMPESSRFDDERIQRFFHFDQTWWRQSSAWMPHLQKVQEALWQDRKLEILYRLPQPLEVRHLVSPYGLVVKAGRWYLVCEHNGSVFVYRLSELLDVKLSDETFTHPEDFDLAAFWSRWCQRYEGFLTVFTAALEVAPAVFPLLPKVFGSQVEEQLLAACQADTEGWVRIDVTFESFEAAREKVLGLGCGVRVVAPLALRLSVLDYAEQIVKLYQPDGN
ncbi:MAG: YafY family transcriptional regulator [Anaerolineaceae bacterium]|nr:YafY family transcriptional regulator [Anaerolineaceae bacterium]